MRHRPLSALAGARDGVTVVEFALLLVPLLTLIFGTLDLGYHAYLRGLANGVLEKAARRATVGDKTKSQVTTLIESEVRTILPVTSRTDPKAVKVTPLSYYNFAAVNGGERITTDTNPLGEYNSGDCYEDRNKNNKYDATSGGGDDLGTADDIMFYKVEVSVPRLFPFLTIVGLNPNTSFDVKTLIRNQPYGEQQVIIRCA